MLSESIQSAPRLGKIDLLNQYKELDDLIKSKNALTYKSIDEFVNDHLETTRNSTDLISFEDSQYAKSNPLELMNALDLF